MGVVAHVKVRQNTVSSVCHCAACACGCTAQGRPPLPPLYQIWRCLLQLRGMTVAQLCIFCVCGLAALRGCRSRHTHRWKP